MMNTIKANLNNLKTIIKENEHCIQWFDYKVPGFMYEVWDNKRTLLSQFELQDMHELDSLTWAFIDDCWQRYIEDRAGMDLNADSFEQCGSTSLERLKTDNLIFDNDLELTSNFCWGADFEIYLGEYLTEEKYIDRAIVNGLKLNQTDFEAKTKAFLDEYGYREEDILTLIKYTQKDFMKLVDQYNYIQECINSVNLENFKEWLSYV